LPCVAASLQGAILDLGNLAASPPTNPDRSQPQRPPRRLHSHPKSLRSSTRRILNRGANYFWSSRPKRAFCGPDVPAGPPGSVVAPGFPPMCGGPDAICRSPFPLITSLQTQRFHTITHSFAQRRRAISLIFNRFRTLSIATGVCPPALSSSVSERDPTCSKDHDSYPIQRRRPQPTKPLATAKT